MQFHGVCMCVQACVRACVRVSGDEFENSLTLWVYYGPVIYERSDAYYEYWTVKSSRQRLCIFLQNLNFYRIATQLSYDWTSSQTFNWK